VPHDFTPRKKAAHKNFLASDYSEEDFAEATEDLNTDTELFFDLDQSMGIPDPTSDSSILGNLYSWFGGSPQKA
jgi:hypothetical protein